ncbi:hypothetical protein M8J76_011170 [Diaphorina citri]|nr:hypothetical protein M8J75_007421 [Diaphorina citri]KAI5745446.1 hypothetical protein M8J76_011170 [Diaphorina citri]
MGKLARCNCSKCRTNQRSYTPRGTRNMSNRMLKRKTSMRMHTPMKKSRQSDASPSGDKVPSASRDVTSSKPNEVTSSSKQNRVQSVKEYDLKSSSSKRKFHSSTKSKFNSCTHVRIPANQKDLNNLQTVVKEVPPIVQTLVKYEDLTSVSSNPTSCWSIKPRYKSYTRVKPRIIQQDSNTIQPVEKEDSHASTKSTLNSCKHNENPTKQVIVCRSTTKPRVCSATKPRVCSHKSKVSDQSLSSTANSYSTISAVQTPKENAPCACHICKKPCSQGSNSRGSKQHRKITGDGDTGSSQKDPKPRTTTPKIPEMPMTKDKTGDHPRRMTSTRNTPGECQKRKSLDENNMAYHPSRCTNQKPTNQKDLNNLQTVVKEVPPIVQTLVKYEELASVSSEPTSCWSIKPRYKSYTRVKPRIIREDSNTIQPVEKEDSHASTKSTLNSCKHNENPTKQVIVFRSTTKPRVRSATKPRVCSHKSKVSDQSLSSTANSYSTISAVQTPKENAPCACHICIKPCSQGSNSRGSKQHRKITGDGDTGSSQKDPKPRTSTPKIPEMPMTKDKTGDHLRRMTSTRNIPGECQKRKSLDENNIMTYHPSSCSHPSKSASTSELQSVSQKRKLDENMADNFHPQSQEQKKLKVGSGDIVRDLLEPQISVHSFAILPTVSAQPNAEEPMTEEKKAKAKKKSKAKKKKKKNSDSSEEGGYFCRII